MNDSLWTPLHLAYLTGQTQNLIAEYLIDTMCMLWIVMVERVDWIKLLEYCQSKRIHYYSYIIEQYYYGKLVNFGTDDENAVSLAMEQFPSLKDGPTQSNCARDIDHDTALKENTHFITKRLDEPP